MADFEAAVGVVQPSAKREGFATIPGVTWDDVGALGEVKEELQFSVSRPIKYPEEYEALGLEMCVGVLLYGPPGCGKTLVAKAIANDAGANFISIKGPELLNKYVGESERAVRQLFSRARASAPCVLFFDEMDAMAPRRGSDGNGAAERVVNQLLTEMDGLDSRRSVYIIAATNRPDMIDPALLRPGRLDKLLFVPLPDAAGRASILATALRCVPTDGSVDVGGVARDPRCDGLSGADLAAVVREACVMALRDRVRARQQQESAAGAAATPPAAEASGVAAPAAATAVGPGDTSRAAASCRSREISGIGIDSAMPQRQQQQHEPLRITQQHLLVALRAVGPSVSPQDARRYERLRKSLRRARGHLESSTNNEDDGPSKLSEGPPS